MNESLPAANFQWPLAGGPHPVTLTLRRDQRNGQLDLRAWCTDEGYLEPWAQVSVIPHDGVSMFLCAARDEVYVKNYSEAEGLLDELVSQGFVVDLQAPVRPHGSFVAFPRVRLTDKAKALAPELFGRGDPG